MVNVITDVKKFRNKGEAVGREQSHQNCERETQKVRSELQGACSGGRAGGEVGAAVDPGPGEK